MKPDSEVKLFDKPHLFLENIIQTIPIDLVVFDTSHRYLFVSNTAIKDQQLREWIIGKTDIDYCQFRNKPFELAEKRSEVFQKTLIDKKPSATEETIKSGDQSQSFIRMFYPVLDDEGEVEYVVGYGYETTALRESREIIQRQTVAIENATDGIAVLDKEGKFFYLNDAHVKLFGYDSADELIGKTWREIYGPGEIRRIETEIFPILQSGKWQGETIGMTRQGLPVFQEITLTYLPDVGMICICRDISQIKQQMEELKKLAMVVENMKAMVIITNEKGIIEWVNPAFSKISGYSALEAEGKSPAELLHGKDTDPVIIRSREEAISRGEEFEGEFLNYSKTGNPYWVKIQCKPLRDEAGKIIKYFSIQEDITEKRQMEIDLVLAKEAAEVSALTKRRFLANMSHEIRTPINAIMGLSEQLHKANLSDDHHNLIDIIYTSANNLLVVLNDILDLSKIEEGKLNIVSEPFDIRDTCNRAVQVLQHKADEKGIQLSLKIDETISTSLLGDPYRLNQVLLNIIGNAIKFTDQGSVKIDCKLLMQNDQRQILGIDITDTGIGMDSSTLEKVFIAFHQGQQGFERRFGGTGLGLNICHNLVQLMKGEISLESTQGRGTTVSLEIPFSISERSVQQEEEIDFNSLAGKSILLVEDNKFNRLVASVILKKFKVGVTEAENGEEAIKKIKEGGYDLVLMDIQMPVMDGLTATQIIRAELKSDIPIIALTAHALEEEKQNCMQAGVNDFLSKPFLESQLLTMINKWVKPLQYEFV
jgi:PAS domain S-box-containing protein